MPVIIGRRQLMASLGAAAAWPLAARAQQAGMRNIGFMGASAVTAVESWVTAFVQRLRELGWVEGRNVAIEYRWAEGRFERLAAFAAEFVRQRVDIIVAEGTVTTLAAKQATATIPIVFPIAGGPVGNNLVASLARPGGNVTGLSIQATDLAPKRLELFREILPDLVRLAIMAPPVPTLHSKLVNFDQLPPALASKSRFLNPASRGHWTRVRGP
jgi:ABC-type uncharacterized transport system substrate-binding protein